MKKKETIISIVLVLLILGGIFGMAIGSRPSNDGPDIDWQEPEELPMQVYFAEATSKIREVQPTLLVISETDFFDSQKIQQDVLEIDGVLSAFVEFNQIDEENIVVIINANIEKDNQESIVDEIKNLEYLLSDPVEFYKRGIIDLSEKILFTDGFDENKSLEYQFVDHRIDAILNINSRVDDEISGQIQGVFRGERPESLIFFEISNITQTPQMVFGEQEFEVLEWFDEYFYVIESSLENSVEKNILEEVFENNVEVFKEIDSTVVFSGDYNLSNIDFNFSQIQGVDEVNSFEEEIVFFLDSNISFEDYMQVLDVIEENNFNLEDIIKEPTVLYQVNLIGEFLDVSSSLEEINLSIREINKKGIIDISNIIIDEKEYFYQEQEYEFWFEHPKNTNQESFIFTVQAYAQEKEILFLMIDKN